MSELGNKVRDLRGKDSLQVFAKKAGLSFGLIGMIEKGADIKKETLLKLVKNLRLSKDTEADLLVAWVRQKLGEKADLLSVEPKQRSDRLKDAQSFEIDLVTKIRDLPRRFQEEIHKAIDRPAVLRSIENLNQLHDTVTAPDNKKPPR